MPLSATPILSQISWCKVEVSVGDPKLVNPFSDTDDKAPRDMPPLTLLSLSMRSVVNHKSNTREIVAVSSRIWENSPSVFCQLGWHHCSNSHVDKIDGPVPPEQLPSISHTVVRPLGNYPNGFETKARAH